MKLLTKIDDQTEFMNKMLWLNRKKVKQLGITMTNMNCTLFQNKYAKTQNEVLKDILRWEKL